MRKVFYPRIAANNIKTNKQYCIPFLITGIISVALFYIICALGTNNSLQTTYGGNDVKMAIGFATGVTGLFFAVFLFYTQSFLIKRRKKEFGLYSMLGMEKKHISFVIFFESLYNFVISIVFGLATGILLSKLGFILLARLLHFDVPLGFELHTSSVIATLAVFAAIFILMTIKSIIEVSRAKTVDLLHAESYGEKEPKTKLITAIIGAVSLAAGYTLALTVDNPISAIPIFTLAVVLVMIGTYCLFTAGSIVLLKTLKKNKAYYYKTRHFVSVSGMMYRMKQNAIGLGNICILCTAVLVMISTTTSLYFGMEDLIRTRYPRDISVELKECDNTTKDAVRGIINAQAQKAGITPENISDVRERTIVMIQEDDLFTGKRADADEIFIESEVSYIKFMLLEDYNKLAGKSQSLKSDEVLMCVINGTYKSDTMDFDGYKLKVKEHVNDIELATSQLAMMVSTYYVIVPDEQVIADISKNFGYEYNGMQLVYGFDTTAEPANEIALGESINTALTDGGYEFILETSEGSRASFYTLYGSLLFVGVFLGLVFMLAAVLIIYYKQISEGLEDRERYRIMQNVGLSKDEVKSSIRSQVLTVFFLPLVTAFIHLAFAYPVLVKLMMLLNLLNTSVFLCGLLITAAVFAVIYAIVYSVTAKSYYRIVS